jgi:hypothetical protein
VAALRIGPIEVRIEREAVRAYARVTALDEDVVEGDEVPATFPAVWLWHPAAAAILAEAADHDGRAPVLTAQRFEYRAPLVIGEAYRFEIERFADRDDPDTVLIEASVQDLAGRLAAVFAATYRLFSLSQAVS